MSNITASIDLNKNVCVDKSLYVYYGDFSQMKQELATCFNNYLEKEILCDFKQSGSNYICYIRNVLVENSETTEISGSHLPEKTDNDVSTVIFINSTLKEIPQKIFLKFQKLQTLNVESTGLTVIKKLESCNNLENFIASYNQISALETKLFENCINLKFLDLHYNKIQKLRGNVFESNTKLEEIDFSRNEINDIEPCGFLRNQPEFRSINLYENQCVHANIRVWNGDFSEMERLLNPCFISWYSNLYN
jgi:Leucine-rich repeat (LRR) protein